MLKQHQKEEESVKKSCEINLIKQYFIDVIYQGNSKLSLKNKN